MWRSATPDKEAPRRGRKSTPRPERPERSGAGRRAGSAAAKGGRGKGRVAERRRPSEASKRDACSNERSELLTILESTQSRIYVSDPETYELLYMNRPMRKAFGDAIGEKCYFAIKGRGSPCPHCTNDRLFGENNTGKPYVWERQNAADGRWYRCVDTAVRWPDGRMVRHETETDITEYKLVEEALKDSEAKYRRLLENAQEAILIIQDGLLKFFNQKVPELTGYDDDELRTKPFFDIVHPEDRQLAARRHARRIRGEAVPNDYTLRIVAKDGETRWIEVNAVLFRWDGRPATLNFVTDVTERKEAEKELRESRERYSSLFQSSNDGIIIHDQEGKILEVNQRVAEQFGYDPEEMLSLTIAELHPEEAREDWRRAFEAIAVDGVINLEIPFRTKDGHVFPAEVSSSLFEAGGSTLVQGVVRDITERKRAEDIQSVLFHISQAVSAATNLGELLATIHRQLSRLIYTRNFYVALYDAERDVYTFPYYIDECDELDDLTSVELKKSLTDYVRRTGEGLLVDEKVQSRLEAEGEVALVGSPSPSWMGVPLKAGNRVIGVVVVQSYVEESLYTRGDLELLTFVAENIAVGIERKHAEQEREGLEAQVQHAQKLESLGILAGGIAHDFNNLLTGILGYADLTLMRLPEDSPVRRGLEEIKGAAERAAELSRQMLAYSGKGSFVIEPIDLNEVVTEMGDLLKVTISKRARIEYDLADKLPLVVADTTQVRQVVMNLITNAAEALCNGEGAITLSSGVTECDRAFLSECYLDEQLPEGAYVTLDVHDTGCGMDSETLSKIFDPFFTTKFTGRGLGLAATLGIVRGHRGTVHVASAPGGGTTFRVLLPVADEEVQRAGKKIVVLEDWYGTGTVLLVDDEATVRDVGSKMLEEAGLTVVTASDGREAIEVYQGLADEIGCVVLDLTMPNMSGEETLRELQRIRGDVRVVLSSGYSEQEVIGRFEGQGIAGFVQKPYLVSRLVSQVGQAIKEVAAADGTDRHQ